jgi:hypothetical protein
MTNFQVYKKTLSFSVIGFLVDLLVFVGFIAICALGFIIADKAFDKGLIGLALGFVVAIVFSILMNIFVSNVLKAGHIAMITRGVTEDALPENVLSEGKKAVKERFATITAFIFITRAIKNIFRQIGRIVTKVGTAVGGETGGNIASIINSAVQVLLGYLCDCCLGWVFYRKDKNAARATCEGAAIFFKHGKTLFKNIVRIFGLGLLSLAIIGGAFFGIGYLISSTMLKGAFDSLAGEIAEASLRNDLDVPQAFMEPKTLMLIVSGVAALFIWNIIHSVFVRPFILVGVMRNFTASGIKEMPTEAELNELDKKSPRFAKIHANAIE